MKTLFPADLFLCWYCIVRDKNGSECYRYKRFPTVLIAVASLVGHWHIRSHSDTQIFHDCYFKARLEDGLLGLYKTDLEALHPETLCNF